MNVLLYCYGLSVVNNMLGLVSSGIWPKHVFTSPPKDYRTFPYELLSEVDLAYIVLHGSPGFPSALFGGKEIGKGPVAMTTEALYKSTDFKDLVVILEGCYGIKTYFPRIFVSKGARAVIADRSPTYDRLVFLGKAGRDGRKMLIDLKKGKRMKDVATGSFEVVGDSEWSYV
jgi:hypothetical protein